MLSASLLAGFDHVSTTTRGFTGHEMLDEVGIIHMNGRIYDPKLGRFLQADPIVQSPTNTQSLNRYSYGFNNPLNGTDPSGYSFFGDAIKLVVNGAITFAAYVACGPACAAAMAGTLTKAQGGTWKKAISVAALTYVGFEFAPGIGAGFREYAAYSLQMGVVGGISGDFAGGNFGHSFLSAGIGAAASGLQLFGPGDIQRVLSAAVVGGTVSELTGGKFANGAATAAFSSIMVYVANDSGYSPQAPTPEIEINSQIKIEMVTKQKSVTVPEPKFRGLNPPEITPVRTLPRPIVEIVVTARAPARNLGGIYHSISAGGFRPSEKDAEYGAYVIQHNQDLGTVLGFMAAVTPGIVGTRKLLSYIPAAGKAVSSYTARRALCTFLGCASTSFYGNAADEMLIHETTRQTMRRGAELGRQTFNSLRQ